MSRSLFVVAMMPAVMMAASAGVALGQSTSQGPVTVYPCKTIRILTSEAGGANEFSARLIAQGISRTTGSTGHRRVQGFADRDGNGGQIST